MAHRMARPSWSHGGGWCTCHWGEGPTLWLMRVYDMGYDSPQSLMKFRIWPGFSYYFVAEKQMLKPVTIHHPCIFRRVCPVKIDCHSARSISIRLGATFLVMACAFKFRPTFFHTMFFTNEILQLFEVWTAWSWIKLSPTSRALRPLGWQATTEFGMKPLTNPSPMEFLDGWSDGPWLFVGRVQAPTLGPSWFRCFQASQVENYSNICRNIHMAIRLTV